MKVILSTDSVKYPLTGIGRYTYELIQEFKSQNYFEDLKFLNGYKILDEFTYDSTSVPSGSGSKLVSFLKNTPLVDIYRIASPFVKSRALHEYEDYLFHGTNFHVPKFRGMSVSTFHDLSPFTMAHCIEPSRAKYLRKQLLKTIENSDHFITDTEYTRLEFINFFNIPESKVHAVHLACSDSFKPLSFELTKMTLSKFGLEYKKYVLCVSTIEPRKNINNLILAYSMLSSEIKSKHPLILVGHKGWCSEDSHKLIEKYKHEGWLKYLDYVTSDELPLVYASAKMFIFPSIYEGFGLPILEAMRSGVPVISSSASCLPEVVGDAALFFEPNDIDGLSKVIANSITDDILLEELREQGIIRANEFSWSKCATETQSVYNKIIY